MAGEGLREDWGPGLLRALPLLRESLVAAGAYQVASLLSTSIISHMISFGPRPMKSPTCQDSKMLIPVLISHQTCATSSSPDIICILCRHPNLVFPNKLFIYISTQMCSTLSLLQGDKQITLHLLTPSKNLRHLDHLFLSPTPNALT